MLGDIISGGMKIIGGMLSDDAASKNNERNIAMQREFAQNGIQWKVADAKKAGIHPLYAMGNSGISFSPQTVGGSGLGSALASAGQDVSRAISSTQDQPTRDGMFARSVQELQLQNFTLKNDLLAAQIAKLRHAPNPPMPSPGTATEAPLDDKMQERKRNVIGGSEIRSHPGYGPSEGFTSEYGEPIEWIYAPLKTYMDWAYHNSGARSVAEYRSIIDRRNRRAREKTLGRSRIRDN